MQVALWLGGLGGLVLWLGGLGGLCLVDWRPWWPMSCGLVALVAYVLLAIARYLRWLYT